MTDKVFEGKNIDEVWDYRLSTAVPVIERESGTWCVNLYSKVDGTVPIVSHDTGIEAVDGDERDESKVIPCFEWLYSVRDAYALDDIEERKPKVAAINKAVKALSDMGAV